MTADRPPVSGEPTPRDFGNCEKCGWTEQRVEYHDGRYDFIRDQYDPCRWWHGERKEHFRVTCARCHFGKAVPA